MFSIKSLAMQKHCYRSINNLVTSSLRRSFTSARFNLQEQSTNPATFGLLSKLQQQLQQQELQDSTSNKNNSTTLKKKVREEVVKYVLHCQFTKNNTLITFTSVNEDLNFEQNNAGLSFNEKVLYYLNLPEKTLVSLSAGSVGFRKWQRGEYELAYKASLRLFQIIEDKNYLGNGKKIELVFQDFGKGRKLFEDLLLGKPGNLVRQYISRITDKTKIKFGGVRSPKPRRL